MENEITYTEFTLLNMLYKGSLGRPICRFDTTCKEAISSKQALNKLIQLGFAKDAPLSITPKGEKCLAKYKVDNAIILAAGASTRCIPLSLELPKGLFEVKGETLIERQIRQLQDAGISEIVIVVGYQKEKFKFLKQKYNVRLIENDTFNVKNNTESIYLAKDYINNSYICACDNFFIENPFNEFEYRSFCSGETSLQPQNEIYATIDNNDTIIALGDNKASNKIVFGHSFWSNSFSSEFINILKNNRKKGIYDQLFWERVVGKNLCNLPPFYYKEYEKGNIFEFDYFSQLRHFDSRYLDNTHSEIIRNIKLIFQCEEEDIINFRTISKGLTNTSFIFQIDGVDYIYRHPGEGTEKIINRKNEKNSLKLMNEHNIDPTYVYMDINEGWKISKYIKSFREPDYSSKTDAKIVTDMLKKLHSLDIEVSYGLDPWRDALKLESYLTDLEQHEKSELHELKRNIQELYSSINDDGVKKCFCHGDTYQPNWMFLPNGDVYLIDWEYSGYSDPGIDVGYYIVDAKYDIKDGIEFIKMYLGKDCNDKLLKHYLVYTALIAYYWYVWALYRKSCGANMEQNIHDWKDMSTKYANYLLNL